MSEETVTIRVPGVVDLTQYRVQVGDTVAFIEKINGTQSDLENWAEQLTWCATDLQTTADQIGTRHTEIVQVGQQVAEDAQEVRDQMNTALSPAVAAAVDAVATAEAAAILRIDSVEPVSEADLHARALYF